MDSLIIALAWLAALVLAAIKFVQEIPHGFYAWCLPLAVVIIAVLGIITAFGTYRSTRP